MHKSILINHLNKIIHFYIVTYEDVCGNEIVGWGTDN